MAIVVSVAFQYVQEVWGTASVELDGEKLARDYGSVDSMTEEDWRNVIQDREAYAPKGYDVLIDYEDSNVETETFSNFSADEPYDTTEPDTTEEAR